MVLLLLFVCSPVLAVPKFGDIDLDFKAKDLLSALGEPDEKGEIYEEAATGEWVQAWVYGNLELTLSSSSANGEQTVYAIYAKGETPYSWLGVSVGMPKAQAIESVQKYRKSGAELQASGEGYGLFWEKDWIGLTLLFSDGKVSELFIGPGPE